MSYIDYYVRKIFLFFTMMLGVVTVNAYAITINSTFETADDNGGATYTITNDTEDRIFLNVVMYEFYTEKGELKKNAYTRDNIEDWKISVRPARAVINPGFEKDFRVTMNCKSDCQNLDDQAFQIAFIPTPYFKEGEQPKHAMQIAVGFGANFVNQGKEQNLNYEISREGSRLFIYNHSRSMNRVNISACPDNVKNSEKTTCEKTVNVISNRNLPVELNEYMKNKKVTVTISSSQGSDVQTVILEP